MCSLLSNRNPGRPGRGFTIIELVVAIGITAVMVTLMLNISINMLKAWNTTGGQLTTGNQARIVLDYLSQDLQSAVFKRDGNVWLAATVQRDQSTGTDDANITSVFNSAWSNGGNPVKPNGNGAVANSNSLDLAGTLPADTEDRGKIENLRFGKAGVWLRFFTTQPDSNSGLTNLSAPRAVSYQISRGRIGSTASEQYFYALFRSEVAPNATFTAGYDITDASQYDDSTKPCGIIRQPTADEIIANNVVDFGVRLYERDASGNLLEVFPARRNASGTVTSVSTSSPVTYLVTSSTSSYTRFGNTANLNPGFPAVAEVMVRILTPEGQRLLQAFEESKVKRPPGSNTDDDYWWELVTEHSQVYVRRIEIRSTPL